MWFDVFYNERKNELYTQTTSWMIKDCTTTATATTKKVLLLQLPQVMGNRIMKNCFKNIVLSLNKTYMNTGIMCMCEL